MNSVTSSDGMLDRRRLGRVFALARRRVERQMAAVALVEVEDGAPDGREGRHQLLHVARLHLGVLEDRIRERLHQLDRQALIGVGGELAEIDLEALDQT